MCVCVKQVKNLGLKYSYCNPAMSICEKSMLLVELSRRAGVAAPLVLLLLVLLLLNGDEGGGGCLMARTLQFKLFATLVLLWDIANLHIHTNYTKL